MTEGWRNGDYLVLFDPKEAATAARGYGIDAAFPGHRLFGLVGWDDFVLASPDGRTWRVATVPLVREHMTPMHGRVGLTELEPDDRFIGRIKWYITPIVFGGHPMSSDNIMWVDMATHQKLVRFWNGKYLELTRGS